MFHKGFQGTCPRKMGILLTNDKWDVADGNGEAEVTTRQRPSEKSALTFSEKLQAGIKKSIRVEKVI